MSYAMHQGASSVPPPSQGFGRTFLIGGTVVAAGLFAVWVALLRSKDQQERKGINPIYEQLIAHVGKSESINAGIMPVIRAQSMMPAAPVKDRNHKMMTLPRFYNSEEYLNIGGRARHSAPSPQRAKDGQGEDAYGKTSEYVKNYNATDRAAKVSKMRGLRQSAQI